MNNWVIYFACDAGLGSSALGASLLSRLLKARNINHKINNCTIYDIPHDANIIVCHEYFKDICENKYKHLKKYYVSNYMDQKSYERIAKDMFSSEVLKKENIILNCEANNSDDAIVAMGQRLKKAGYINERYIDGMLERDHSLTTYIGNDIAIPHGEFEYKDEIIKTGLGIMIFPNGISWGNGKARIVVGIAAKNDEHMEILANIATKLSDMEVVERVIACNDIDYIYDLFMEEEVV